MPEASPDAHRPVRWRRLLRAASVGALLAAFAVVALECRQVWQEAQRSLNRADAAWSSLQREMDMAQTRAIRVLGVGRGHNCEDLQPELAHQVQHSHFVQSLGWFPPVGSYAPACFSSAGALLKRIQRPDANLSFVGADSAASEEAALVLARAVGEHGLVAGMVSGNALSNLLKGFLSEGSGRTRLHVGGQTLDSSLKVVDTLAPGTAFIWRDELAGGAVLEHRIERAVLQARVWTRLYRMLPWILLAAAGAAWAAQHLGLGRRVASRVTGMVLRLDLMRDSFVPAYQPVVDSATGKVVGVEVLLRRARPGGGLELPGAFLGELLRAGLIVPVTEQLLRRVARDVREQPGLQGVFVSVNLAREHLGQERALIAACEAFLAVARPLGTTLTLELSEQEPLQLDARCLGVLNHLRGQGVRIALDDFGTGNSNLEYLARFRPDVIKLDRVIAQLADRDDERRLIPRAMVELARQLEIEVVAEGVETRAQLLAMQALGVRLIQGFCYFKPMRAAQLPRVAALPADWAFA